MTIHRHFLGFFKLASIMLWIEELNRHNNLEYLSEMFFDGYGRVLRTSMRFGIAAQNSRSAGFVLST